MLCGVRFRFNLLLAGELGVVGGERGPECRQLLMRLEPSEALGGFHSIKGPPAIRRAW